MAAPSLPDALAAHEEGLLACVHCGFCLPACPTYTRLGDEADSPRGRLHLMRAVAEGRLDAGSGAFRTHIDRCLGCRACETVCPSGVEYGWLLELARGEAARSVPLRGLPGLLLRVFASRGATRVLLLVARALRATGLPGFLATRLPASGPLARARLALAMLAASGSWRGGRRPDPGGSVPASARRGGEAGSAGLLEGCVQGGLFRRVNGATGRVLEANGWSVTRVEGQGCCGALHAHAGDLATARDLARRNVAAFGEAGVDVVAVNAAGCGAAMKEYGRLLAADPVWAERATEVAGRVRDVTELLAERGPEEGGPLALSVTYDAPCHLLHAQKVAREPAAVLDAVPGLDRRPLEGAEECCGGAGIYGLTHPELGGRIGRDKAEAVLRSGAELVVTGNPGCAMQIGAWLRLLGSPVRVAHPVEVLDESYRAAGRYGRRGGGG